MKRYLAATNPISKQNLQFPTTVPDNPLDNSLTQDPLDLGQEDTDNFSQQLQLDLEPFRV